MKLFSTQLCNLFYLFFLCSFAGAAPKIIDRTIVIINDEPILESDIAVFQKKIKSKSFQELFGGIPNKVIDNRSAALQLLVEERLVNQQVKKLDLGASPQEIEGQINSILKRNGIGQAQLKELRTSFSLKKSPRHYLPMKPSFPMRR